MISLVGLASLDALLADIIDDTGMIIGEKKRACAELHNVARPADDFAAPQESGHEILQLLALSHYDDLISMADRLICGTVKGNDKGISKLRGRVRLVEKVES